MGQIKYCGKDVEMYATESFTKCASSMNFSAIFTHQDYDLDKLTLIDLKELTSFPKCLILSSLRLGTYLEGFLLNHVTQFIILITCKE